jgi:LacI family transcriptional regulator
MSRTPASVRSIALLTGFSKATVANALRGHPTVAAATAERIRAAAAKVGYARNRFVGGLMSAMRRAQTSGFHGVLACVDFAEPDRPEHGPFHRELVSGARARAGELGFKLEEFVVGAGRLSPARLNTILQARGIHGIAILPSWRAPDLDGLDLGALAVVAADFMPNASPMHSVCCDHYGSLFTLLEQLESRGYRRPGLVLDTGRDERVMLRRSAALHAFQQHLPASRRVPVLEAPKIDDAVFGRWFRRHRPDVVLAHETEVLELIEAEGRAVPRDCGFVCLNLTKAKRPCAALDLQPRLIGARTVELLVAQLQQNAHGVPECPSVLTLLACLVDGPTLRHAGAG